jgi:enamine deaminase RidA (YjgF/YER057c/UK114 family)
MLPTPCGCAVPTMLSPACNAINRPAMQANDHMRKTCHASQHCLRVPSPQPSWFLLSLALRILRSSVTIRPWTKTFFTEIVTVNGPGKTIYLAGVGAEDENAAVGNLPPILHLGNAHDQCRYAYDKIKRALATQGASLADAVKQVVYVTDVRYQSEWRSVDVRRTGTVQSRQYVSRGQWPCCPRHAARDRCNGSRGK